MKEYEKKYHKQEEKQEKIKKKEMNELRGGKKEETLEAEAGGKEDRKDWTRRCGGKWFTCYSPCLWIARLGFESRPGAFPHCGLRGGRSHCYCTLYK